MALDLTSTEVSVPHPSPDQEDVGPSPVLCLGTSDGVFRFFSLGNRDRSAPPCVAAPQPVPEAPQVSPATSTDHQPGPRDKDEPCWA